MATPLRSGVTQYVALHVSLLVLVLIVHKRRQCAATENTACSCRWVVGHQAEVVSLASGTAMPRQRLSRIVGALQRQSAVDSSPEVVGAHSGPQSTALHTARAIPTRQAAPINRYKCPDPTTGAVQAEHEYGCLVLIQNANQSDEVAER
jgi:hypothetical protein